MVGGAASLLYYTKKRSGVVIGAGRRAHSWEERSDCSWGVTEMMGEDGGNFCCSSSSN